jgi:hypothetical protein
MGILGTQLNSYASYSEDLSHIGDRRRVGLWINQKEFLVFGSNGEECDIQVVNPLTDPFLLDKTKEGTFTILDIVDGYLVEEPSIIQDYARYFFRSSKLKAILRPKRFSTSLKETCRKVDLIVVASKEQARIAEEYNANISIIRDAHDELGEPLDIKPIQKSKNLNLFWEGLGFTLFHFEEVADDLGKFLLDTNSILNLVTNESFPRYANSFGVIKSEKIITKMFGAAAKNIRIHSWSQANVERLASICDFGVIPISEKDEFARLKPENKLLIYWRLGLQTLFSDTPAYLRVSSEIGVSDYSVKLGEWQKKLEEITNSRDFLSPNMPKAKDFLIEFHTNEVILGQWKQTLESLPRNTR